MHRLARLTRLGVGRRLLQAGAPCSPPWAAFLAPVLLPAGLHTVQTALQGGHDAAGEKVASAVASAGNGLQRAASPAAAAASAEESVDRLEPGELDPGDFAAIADLYLGGLWTRLERGLREAEGEDFDYEVKPERGAMLVLLPYDGQLAIRKDAQACLLVVENNLFEPFEDKGCIKFRPVDANTWVNEDEQTLTDFVAEALSKYLHADVHL